MHLLHFLENAQNSQIGNAEVRTTGHRVHDHLAVPRLSLGMRGFTMLCLSGCKNGWKLRKTGKQGLVFCVRLDFGEGAECDAQYYCRRNVR